MRTDQKVFELAKSQDYTGGLGIEVAKFIWPGGNGWLDVNGTFSGATAIIRVNCQVEYAASSHFLGYGLNHPDFPSDIFATGTYKFSSPSGLMVFTIPNMTGGDSILDLHMTAIRLDSYETGH